MTARAMAMVGVISVLGGCGGSTPGKDAGTLPPPTDSGQQHAEAGGDAVRADVAADAGGREAAADVDSRDVDSRDVAATDVAAGDRASADVPSGETAPDRPADAASDGPDAATGPDRDKVCGDEGWCWVYPRPGGNRLEGVWAAARDDVWAVGELGTLLRYDGRRWNKVDFPEAMRIDLYSVWGSGPNDVWVGGSQDLLLHWNGSSWQQMRFFSGLVEAWMGIHGTGPNDIWFSHVGSSVLHWDGTRFNTGFTQSTTFYGESVWAMAPNEALVSTYQGHAVRATYFPSTNDVYYTITQVAPPDTILSEVWGATPQEGWIGGQGDIMYRRTGTVSATSASTYTPFDPGTSGDIHGIWGPAANDVWAVGGGGDIVHWDGTRWSPRTSPTRLDLNDVWGTAADDVWAVGDGGALVHWDGRAWTGDRPSDQNLQDVWAAAPDDIWAVGERGAVVRSRGNDVFTAVASPTTENLRRMWGASATDIWMVGDNGVVLEWDGAKFVTWPKLGNNNLTGVWGTSRNDIWAVGGYLFHFDGTAWLPLPLLDPAHQMGGVWTNDPDRVFFAAYYDLVYDYRPSTGRFTTMPITGTQLIWGTGPSDLWVSGYPGDGGHFDGTMWTRFRTDDLYDLWGSGPDDVWGVGYQGDIAHHGPGGGLGDFRSQGLRMTRTTLHGVHGTDATNIWAVGDNGTILRLGR